MKGIPQGRYTKEFREEAVKLVTEEKLSLPEAARRWSLAPSTLAYWVKAYKEGKLGDIGKAQKPLTEVVGAEVGVLRIRSVQMDFRFSEEEESFRQEVRSFLEKEVTPELIQECEAQQYYVMGPHTREFVKKLGAKGWLAAHWPKEYGGQERSYLERLILKEETGRYGVSVGGGGVEIVGPILMRHGSEEQKREFLPRIARGEIEFSLGYTEPNAGTDLASLETRAVPDGDDYIINGQKVYSTMAHQVDYHWLAVRTNPNAPKHRGISLLIVDLKSPGITISPLQTVSGEQTNEVFYDDVRVPRKNRVGEENQGWHYIAEALDFERSSVIYLVSWGRILDLLLQYAKETKRNEKPLAEDPLVSQKLAQLAIEVHLARLHAYRTAWLENRGIVPNIEAAMLKIWGHELDQRLAKEGLEIMGLYGQLEPGSKWAPLRGIIEHLYRFAIHLSYGGGSHELLRSVIACRGMGLPRMR